MTRLLATLSMILLLVHSGCAASTASADAGRSSAQQTVQSLLAAEEYVATAADLKRLGPDVPSQLMRIAQDPDQDIAHRARAVSYLGYYQDHPTVETYLSTLVQTPAAPPTLLRRGLVALARSAKAKATSRIAPHLSSSDTLVREAAAKALIETEDTRALQMVHEAATQEHEPFLKKKMHDLADTAASGRLKSTVPPTPQATPEVESTRY